MIVKEESRLSLLWRAARQQATDGNTLFPTLCVLRSRSGKKCWRYFYILQNVIRFILNERMSHAMSKNRNVSGHCLVVAQPDRTCVSVFGLMLHVKTQWKQFLTKTAHLLVYILKDFYDSMWNIFHRMFHIIFPFTGETDVIMYLFLPKFDFPQSIIHLRV